VSNRYWVGGTNTWDATSGTKWSATSGGAGGASVPGVSDDAIFNAASGICTVTLGADVSVNSVDIGGSVSFNASSYDITTVENFDYRTTATASVSMGSGLWTIGKRLSFVDDGILTFSAGTANVKIIGPVGLINTDFIASFNEVWFVGTGSSIDNPSYAFLPTGSSIDILKLSADCFFANISGYALEINSYNFLGYTGHPVTLTTQYIAQIGQINTFEISSGGSGYTLGEFILVSGGRSFGGITNEQAVFQVDGIDGLGAVTSVSFVYPGSLFFVDDILIDDGTGGPTGTGCSIKVLSIYNTSSYQSLLSTTSGTINFANTEFLGTGLSGGAVFNAFAEYGNTDLGYNEGLSTDPIAHDAKKQFLRCSILKKTLSLKTTSIKTNLSSKNTKLNIKI
jgi:hypothetical protein